MHFKASQAQFFKAHRMPWRQYPWNEIWLFRPYRLPNYSGTFMQNLTVNSKENTLYICTTFWSSGVQHIETCCTPSVGHHLAFSTLWSDGVLMIVFSARCGLSQSSGPQWNNTVTNYTVFMWVAASESSRNLKDLIWSCNCARGIFEVNKMTTPNS